MPAIVLDLVHSNYPCGAIIAGVTKTPTRLREHRYRAALSQVELAQLAGIERKTIVRLEQGRGTTWPQTLRKLARALKVKPADLLA